MQQKFKIGDKVKVLTNVYGCDIHGKIGTIIKLGGATCIVERNMQNYDQEEWGRVEEDSWRYAFNEEELELVEDKPEPDYVIGQEVYVSNDFNRYLRKGVLLDAIPRNGLMYVNIGGFDCYVEEERVYTKELKVREGE